MPWIWNGSKYEWKADASNPDEVQTADPNGPGAPATPTPTPAPTPTPTPTVPIPTTPTPSTPAPTPALPGGGGWDEFAKDGSHQNILRQAFAQGLKGEDAVQWATAHGAPQIAYYADRDQYGLPNGYYVAGGDLIKRAETGTYGGLRPEHAPGGRLSSLAASIVPTTKTPTPITPSVPSTPEGPVVPDAPAVPAPPGLEDALGWGHQARPTLGPDEYGETRATGLNPVLAALLSLQTKR